MSIKKLVIGLAVVALVFGVAVSAKAATIEELQAMIAQLTQQLAALSGGTTGTPAAFTYTRVLPMGSTGADVSALQNFLISKGFAIPAGATGTFGPQTQAALAKYQASVAITPASGVFGPITMAHMNSLVATTGTGTGTTGTNTNLQGDEGDITTSEKNSGVNSQVSEGEEDAKVVGFEVEADGSDVALNSVKVTMTAPSSGSTKLDRYVESVDIMMGDKVVGSADVSDFTKNGSVYTQTITLDNVVVRENKKERFYVAVNANNDVDTANLSKAWTVAVSTIRFEDGSGVVSTETVSGVSETFTLESLTTANSVKLKLTEDDEAINKAHTVPVDASSDTNDVELLSFKLKANDSDISLLSMPFTITSSGTGVTGILNDARFLMNGEEVGDIVVDKSSKTGSYAGTFASSSDTTIYIKVQNLDDDDVVISNGDTVSFALVGDVNDLEGDFGNGDSLTVAIDADDIVAEDENGDTVDDTVTSGAITTSGTKFASSGIMVDRFATASTNEIENVDTTTTDNQGKFVTTFDVSAFDDAAYITLTAASSTAAASTDGVSFQMENASTGATIQTGTTTAILERVSGGSITSNGRLKIEDGQKATLRLTVYHDAAAAGYFRIQMNEVAFNASDAAGNDAQATTPASDFESGSVYINQ